MSWTNLPTNHQDAEWSGAKQYVITDIGDNKCTITDVTSYNHREDSLYGAEEVNKANGAINTLMNELVPITRAEYEALPVKENRLYFIKG